jgi:hypothetical protein
LVAFKPNVISFLREKARLFYLLSHVVATFMSDLPLHHAFLQLVGAYGTLLCGGLGMKD